MLALHLFPLESQESQSSSLQLPQRCLFPLEVQVSQSNNLPHQLGVQESLTSTFLCLVRRISHTSDTKPFAVGINAIKEILEGNPNFCQLSGLMDFINKLL